MDPQEIIGSAMSHFIIDSQYECSQERKNVYVDVLLFLQSNKLAI